LADSFDEELEMEIDDDQLGKPLAEHPDRDTLDRRLCFKDCSDCKCPTSGSYGTQSAAHSWQTKASCEPKD
jgi:hypothetical protein